jgi:peroxiredoxin Q/BCP
MTIQVGEMAPKISLPAVGGKTISLDDYLGKQVVVLYFYPKDMTPGCTQEACDFRDRSEELRQMGAVVLGLSPDSVKSHEKFIHEKTLNFPLLADEDHQVCEAYGVWTEKTNYGKHYMGVERSTFLIGKDGRIARAWRKVKVPNHVQEVIEAVKAISV